MELIRSTNSCLITINTAENKKENVETFYFVCGDVFVVSVSW